MVESNSTANPTTRDEMKLNLRARCAEILAKKDQMEIKSTLEDGNIEVRADWDEESRIICVAEMKVAKGLTPDDFKAFFNVWEECILEINPILNFAKKVDEDQGYDIVRTTAKAPWPISDRGMVVCKYLDYGVEPEVD